MNHPSTCNTDFLLYQTFQQQVQSCTERTLLDCAERWGFSGKLWHSFLALQLVLDENPFSLACERRAAPMASLSWLAKEELAAIRQLFSSRPEGFSDAHWTFFSSYEPASRQADILCEGEAACESGWLCEAGTASKPKSRPGRSVPLLTGQLIQTLGADLAKAADDSAFFDCLADFYRRFGTGSFACCPAFELGGQSLCPVGSLDPVTFSDLLGYEYQKERLLANTKAFCAGRPANNVLLYGDSGTGKSTCIRALVNAFWEEGLRLVEVHRHQFQELPALIAQLRLRNYRFLLYLDDLSFEEFETEYKYLKAVIEGGAEPRPENLLIYATSNRRHLIREQLGDRSDMEHGEDVHRSDTLEEKFSLASRFGLALCFARPDRQRFYDMAIKLARRAGISEAQLSDEALRLEANRFSMRGGGLSGRTARQFVDDLLSGGDRTET